MDIKSNNWFGQLTVSGVGEPFNESGSIMSITGRFFRELEQLNARQLTGGKMVTIRFADKPFDSKMRRSSDDAAREAWADIDTSLVQAGPHETENYESYYLRLLSEGQPEPAARFFADDWFGQMHDVQTLRWMNDPKVQRFMQLQVNKLAFENAGPKEYEELKLYVKTEYPERATQITFRTA
jgi:hypothetical protein